ncbi:hypothetical protein T484DRAFT_1925009, partial [Baffinella frigidus]
MGGATSEAAKAAKNAAFSGCVTAMSGGTINDGCVSLILSKVLGMSVVLGGMAFKVPQIIKIHKNKSVAGVSVIVLQIRHYGQISMGTFLPAVAAYIAVVAFLFSDAGRDMELQVPQCDLQLGLSSCKLSSARLQHCLQAISTLVMIASRIPTINSNFQTKEVSNLSIVTWGLNFAGASIRVFTTLRELPDERVLLVVLSLIIILQITAYGGKKKDKVKGKGKKE